MNTPERSASFILDDDQEKIDYAADTKVSLADYGATRETAASCLALLLSRPDLEHNIMGARRGAGREVF